MWCRIYQLAIEKELDSAGCVQRPSVTRHLQRCADCREFAHRLTRLERQLRSEPSLDIPDELTQRLQHAIGHRLDKMTPQTAGSDVQVPLAYRLRYAVCAAAAVAVIALAGLYLQLSKQTETADPMSHFTSNAEAFQARMALLARLPEQSLEAEMHKLLNGARSAADFIGSCLPAAPTALDAATTDTSGNDHR